MDQAAWASSSIARAMSTSILSGCRLNPRPTSSFRDLALVATGIKLSSPMIGGRPTLAGTILTKAAPLVAVFDEWAPQTSIPSGFSPPRHISPIHHNNSAIEFILRHLGLKPLRAPQPSVSLLM